MVDKLLHIRVGKKIKDDMQELIDQGLFTNQTEIAREAMKETDMCLNCGAIIVHEKGELIDHQCPKEQSK